MAERGAVTPRTPQEDLIYRLGLDHRLAHESLFGHRHSHATPPFHYDMIDELHSDAPRIAQWAFRNAAKTTRAEEAVIIKALYRRHHNMLIIGESEERAAERLAAIKYEFEYNEHIEAMFGSVVGPKWHETFAELSNGVVIQAKGRGQSLRGIKHLQYRPDFVLIDDIENEENVAKPEFRDATELYIIRVVIPSMASPACPVRALLNMLDPDCLVVRLQKRKSWIVKKYPIEHFDAETGGRKATWEDMFPITVIDGIKQEFEEAGAMNEYQQEYMGDPADPSARTFKSSMIKVEPTVRRWEPTYAMYDPARTVGVKSAHTGKVVFSWVGTKLIVWEGDGQLWMPDKIIEDMFQTCDTYNPIELGVEKEGLEEFIMQPLRAEQTRRHQIIPVKVMKAPVGKLAFIRSLQPFFSSGDVVFAQELPVLKAQLLSFPTGRIDVPNALAYALRMRPGLPIYENFTHKNVVEDLATLRQSGAFLALGATRQYTTAVLVQVAGTGLRVLADFVREGDPGTTLADIFVEASLITPKFAVFAGHQHWNSYDTIGLQPAAKRALQAVRRAGDPAQGREDLRKKIDALTHGQPALQVSTRARWTLNGFAGGYARTVKAGAQEVFGVADDGPYKTLMEALEAFVAVVGGALERDGEDHPNYAVDAQGRKYLSARATHGSR
jgi:hypothetical protein